MELVLEWSEFVRLARWIKWNLTPDWEPVLVAPVFELAVDPDNDVAYKHDRMLGRVWKMDFDAAARLARVRATFGQLFLGPMRSYTLGVEELNAICPDWMRVAVEGWG